MSTDALIQVEHAPVPTTIVQPRRAIWDLELRDLWEYRELLGVAWAVLQPLMATLIFSIFFGRLARMPSDGVPYPVFAYVAMVAWLVLRERTHRVVQ
jgi:lipopolysaccharide transport system permease protein